jgi:hypothetical protein
VADVVSEGTSEQRPPAGEESPFFRQPSREIVVNPRRFGLAYFVLAIGVGIAVGLAIVLLGRGGSHHAATHQGFKPKQSGELGAKEIAHHVGIKYREENGAPIAAVVGQRPNFGGIPLSFYFIRPHDAQDTKKDVAIFNVGNGIMYTVCGLGKNCATASTETPADTELLKREALELTLTTFKSDSDVQTVTTLLPPLQQGTLAIIFKRSDLGSWISKPLSTLLPNLGKIKSGEIGTNEAERIDSIEAGALYTYDPVQGADGNAYLKLDPLG